MKLWALVFFAARVYAQSVTVVSAASYQNVIAPDSLAAAFGTGLARATAPATLDAAGQLPTELASTRVQVNGSDARLIYVSPGQINFLVPGGIASGTASVTVLSTDTNTSRLAAVQIANTAPAIFSADASGAGPGAILNAVTFAPAPFLTNQPHLAIYGTGIRHASNLTAHAVDSKGNRFDLPVEFAGAAPGFFGLDQVNVAVPPDLDGSGAVALTVSTDDSTSNTVTFQMNLLPVNALQLASIALAPLFVNGGDTMTVTISLNGVARAGGFPVVLRSTNLAAQVPAFVTIPEGRASFAVPVTTTAVGTVQTGSISAQAGGVTVSADFEVDPTSQATLSGISVTPTSTLGGRTVQATVTLAGTAPAGGVNVQVATDNALVRPPSAVMVSAGQASVTFPVPTSAVNAAQVITLVATLNRATANTKLTLLPPLAVALDSTAAVGGSSVNGTVTLADPAGPGGATVALTSSDAAAARVPPFTTIASGQTAGAFVITTSQVAGPRTATISAMYIGQTGTAMLTVTPPPVAALFALTISPDRVTGGTSSQGTLTLTAPAPAGGFQVLLASSLLAAAQVPPSLTVPQGLTSAVFTITTFRQPAPQSVMITAAAGNVTKTATLIVQ